MVGIMIKNGCLPKSPCHNWQTGGIEQQEVDLSQPRSRNHNSNLKSFFILSYKLNLRTIFSFPDKLK